MSAVTAMRLALSSKPWTSQPRLSLVFVVTFVASSSKFSLEIVVSFSSLGIVFLFTEYIR